MTVPLAGGYGLPQRLRRFAMTGVFTPYHCTGRRPRRTAVCSAGKFKSKKAKVIYLASTIVINALFVLVFALLEKMYPNFLVYIGKPLLPITFSLSRRIEILLLIITQGLFAFITLVKLSVTLIKK